MKAAAPWTLLKYDHDVTAPREELAIRERPFKQSEGRGFGVQCTGTKRHGGRCRNWAIHGALVCRKHGGQLPTVKKAARARLAALVPYAVAVYQEVLTDPSQKGSTRLRAARYIMAVNGLNPQRSRAATAPTPTHAPLALEQAPDEEIDDLVRALTE